MCDAEFARYVPGRLNSYHEIQTIISMKTMVQGLREEISKCFSAMRTLCRSDDELDAGDHGSPRILWCGASVRSVATTGGRVGRSGRGLIGPAWHDLAVKKGQRRTLRHTCIIALSLLTATSAFPQGAGQAPLVQPSFEVASVKPCGSGCERTRRGHRQDRPGQIYVIELTLYSRGRRVHRGGQRPATSPPVDGMSIATALREQLGRELESARGPSEVLVIGGAGPCRRRIDAASRCFRLRLLCFRRYGARSVR